MKQSPHVPGIVSRPTAGTSRLDGRQQPLETSRNGPATEANTHRLNTKEIIDAFLGLMASIHERSSPTSPSPRSAATTIIPSSNRRPSSLLHGVRPGQRSGVLEPDHSSQRRTPPMPSAPTGGIATT